MLVDGDVVDVRDDHSRSNSGRVHQVARIRVRHEHAHTGGVVAHRHAEKGASARIDDYRLVTFRVLRVAEHGLTTERARALVSHNPFVHARLAHGVSARFHAIQRLLKTDSALLCLHFFPVWYAKITTLFLFYTLQQCVTVKTTGVRYMVIRSDHIPFLFRQPWLQWGCVQVYRLIWYLPGGVQCAP